MTMPRAFVIRGFGTKKDSAGAGSTAHMVRLARALRRVELSIIDSQQLLTLYGAEWRIPRSHLRCYFNLPA